MQKFNYEEWKKLNTNLDRTKQNMEELSKLYIIAHQRVRYIIRTCQTDLHYNPSKDSQIQLIFIKTILQRLANRNNDQYLLALDSQFLQKFQKNLLQLLQLLKFTLITFQSEQKLDFDKLMSITQDRKNKNNQYSLKRQVKNSEERVRRTKSGQCIMRKKQISNELERQQNTKWQQSKNGSAQVSNNNYIHLQNKKLQTTQQFLSRKDKLQSMINSHVETNGFTLNFKKKYHKLDQYLNERKQFVDLIFSQKYSEEINQKEQKKKVQVKSEKKIHNDLNLVFPQLNIKTKYMKKQVKQNILKVIVDVKKQLLRQYQQQLKNKKRQTLQPQPQPPPTPKTYQTPNPLPIPSHLATTLQPTIPKNQKNRFLSTNRTFSQRNKSTSNLKSLRLGGIGKIIKCVLENQGEWKKMECNVEANIVGNKMPYYKNCNN